MKLYVVPPKILAFAGSTRTNSFNKKLVKIVAAGAKDAGAEVTLIDLLDFTMPLYDEDLERLNGIPSTAVRLKSLMLSHQGFLISSPEYNSSISGVLKNTIDWTSRQGDDETPMDCYRGKVAGLVSASPGRLGGLRGLVHVRNILENMGVLVIPEQMALAKANDSFNADDTMKDLEQERKARKIGANVSKLLVKLTS